MEAMMEWELGVVRSWFEEKGYGFLRTARENNIFLHRTVFIDGREALHEGDLVEFQSVRLEAQPRGPRAVRARRLRKTECPQCSRRLIDLTCACGFALEVGAA
jgi:cold shock CspA family protein